MKLDQLYQKTHEWARLEDGTYTVGISDYAQGQLGDVVYVDLPETGVRLKQGETFGAVESVKSANDLHMPVSGEIVAVNEELEDNPELINQGCYGVGWILKVKADQDSGFDQLLTDEQYRQLYK